jgi:hypothetical protein
MSAELTPVICQYMTPGLMKREVPIMRNILVKIALVGTGDCFWGFKKAEMETVTWLGQR